jgi:hypothetical protein
MQEQFRQQRVRELTDAHFSCRNDTTPVQIVVMTKIIFSDYRSPAAEQAYETFWFAAELSAMISRRCIPGAAYHHDVEEGYTNRIRMANRAISEHQHYHEKLDDPRKGRRTLQPGGTGRP